MERGEPGSDENAINLFSRVVPVAVMTTDTFDAAWTRRVSPLKEPQLACEGTAGHQGPWRMWTVTATST